MPPCLTYEALKIIAKIAKAIHEKNEENKHKYLTSFFDTMGTHVIQQASVGARFVATATMSRYEHEK